MTITRAAIADAHCRQAEALASRGLYRRALTELARAATYAKASQIDNIVARRNELSRHVRGNCYQPGDPRMDYDNCVGEACEP
ncbi:Uncharacterised protein [Edwardsiella tarda]|nr:Uncharacterised protein [Edwardsiella tarda]